MQELYYLQSREFLQVLNKYLEKGQIKSFSAERVNSFVSFTETVQYVSQEFSRNLSTPISPLWTVHEDDCGEISQKRAQNIYRVLF